MARATERALAHLPRIQARLINGMAPNKRPTGPEAHHSGDEPDSEVSVPASKADKWLITPKVNNARERRCIADDAQPRGERQQRAQQAPAPYPTAALLSWVPPCSPSEPGFEAHFSDSDGRNLRSMLEEVLLTPRRRFTAHPAAHSAKQHQMSTAFFFAQQPNSSARTMATQQSLISSF